MAKKVSVVTTQVDAKIDSRAIDGSQVPVRIVPVVTGNNLRVTWAENNATFVVLDNDAVKLTIPREHVLYIAVED